MSQVRAQKNFIFSVCSGFGYYNSTEKSCTILNKQRIILEHIPSGDLFYVQPVANVTVEEVPVWIDIIRNPLPFKHFLWPVDMVCLPSGEFALLFSLRALPSMRPFDSIYKQDRMGNILLEWNQNYFNLVRNCLVAWSELYIHGYVYLEFTNTNVFVFEQKSELIFDFSLSVFKNLNGLRTHSMESNINLEFVDPAYFLHRSLSSLDQYSDCYSYAAILFKMLIGKLPYEGTIMEPYEKTYLNDWFEVYGKNATYFIFGDDSDPEKENSIGIFAGDEMYIDRWNRLNERLREMFMTTFQHENVSRSSSNLVFYSPDQWLNAFDEWLNSGGAMHENIGLS